MKPLVVYFSLSGNTRFIAENIAAETGADMLEIKTIVPYKPKSPFMGIKGSIQVLTHFKPRLRFFERNPNSYEMLFIGSPVWNGACSPAVGSFFQKINLKDKKVAIFCCHSGRAGKMLDNMKKRLVCSDIVGEKSFYRPLTFEKVRNARIARSWANKMINKVITVTSLPETICEEDELEIQPCVHF